MTFDDHDRDRDRDGRGGDRVDDHGHERDRDRGRVVEARGCTGGPEARKKLTPWLERVRKNGENDSELDVSLVHLDGPRENEVWSSQLHFDEEVSAFVDELIDEAESRTMNRRGTCAFKIVVQGTNFSRQFELQTKRAHEDMDPWLSEPAFRGTEMRDVIADLLSSKESDRRLIYQLVRDAREDTREMVHHAQRTVESYQRVDLENRALSAKMLKNEKIIDFQIEEKKNKRQRDEKVFGLVSAMGFRIIADKLGIALPPMGGMGLMGPGGGMPGGAGGAPPGQGAAGGGAPPRIPIQAKLLVFMKTLEGTDIKLTDEQQQIFASIAQDVMEWQSEQAHAQQAHAQQAQGDANGKTNGPPR